MKMDSFYKLHKTTNLQQFSGYDPTSDENTVSIIGC
jgi:hypothetical protein